MTRYTEHSNRGSVFESVNVDDLTIAEVRDILSGEGEGQVLVRHLSEPDGSLGCGQIVLKDPDDLEEIESSGGTGLGRGQETPTQREDHPRQAPARAGLAG
jgi:hypothetical protein